MLLNLISLFIAAVVENVCVMAECTYWKIINAAELGRMLCSGLGRVSLISFSAINICVGVLKLSCKIIPSDSQQESHFKAVGAYSVGVCSHCRISYS